MTNLEIIERRNESVTILDLKGNLTLGEDASLLRKTLRLLSEQGEKKILLNLANVSYIDSSGLGELVSGYTLFNKNEGEMKLLNLSPKVHQLMTMTKLLTVFDVFDIEAEAVDSFSTSKVEGVPLAAEYGVSDIRFD
jgi:anti-sigma B factor antagonist